MKLFGINFAIGVATGLILEFEFGTNWSNYSWFVGDIFGAPVSYTHLPAAILRKFGIMCHKDNRTSLCRKFLKQYKYLEGSTAIEVSGRFVGKNYCWIVDQGTCNGYPLHLPAGHLVGFVFQTIPQSYGL